jgi:ATP-binding cassette subfamily F protein 3
VKNLYKSYSDLSVLENVSFDLQKGEKIGFLGINGAGKSTFARILAGIEEFDSGEKYVNPLTEIAYFSQDVTDNLDLESDLLDTMLEENEDFTIPQLRSILGSFLFTDDDIFKKISMLSGGEKSRLTLAKMLLRKSNLLILDEPTNHLDVNSKNVLQQAIIDYSGSVLIVSHDIEFLRPIVGKILDFRERNAKLIYGGIEYYLEKYFDENVNNEINNSEIDKNKKKLQRRNEAEIRQRKYAATKKIKAEIEHIEELISQLEEKIRQIELEMTNPENFSIGEKVKSIQKSYLENKKNLDQQVEKWTELNSEMEKIIKNIEDEYSS